MGTDLGRYDDWLGWLQTRARDDADVLAVWIGGSAAVGGGDEHSDLDVELLCPPGRVNEVYARLLKRARSDFALHDVWELPQATWPDGRQCVLHLRADPGSLMASTRIIDLRLFDLSDEHRFVDVRRHGTPIVLHDPQHLIELRADDDATIWAQTAQAIEQTRQRQSTGEWLIRRALARGNRAEAVDFYLRFALQPLVQLLRIHHCPWRYDFGLRFLREDLGADVARRIESLLPGEDLDGKATTCFAWIHALLAQDRLPGWAGVDRVFVALDTGASPDAVWSAITEPQQLATWLGRVEGTPRAFGSFSVWHDEDTRAEHQVLEWQVNEVLRLTWDYPDEPASEVKLTISEDGRLTVLHTGLDNGLADPVTYAAGWHRHLDFLAGHLAGRDLPFDSYWDDWEARQAKYQALLDRELEATRATER